MTTDPTTPEGRAAMRQLLEDADPGPWAITMRPTTTIVGEDGMGIAQAFSHNAALIIAAVNALPALLDAFDDAECEIERLRGNLVIERRRAGAAEAALDRVRKYARWQRQMAEELHSIGRPYDALPYDNPATALERIIGDRP